MEVLFFLAFLLLPVIIFATSSAKRRRATNDAAATEIRRVIEQHVRALALKKEQLTHVDAYGLLETRRWDKEKQRFFENLILPVLASHRVRGTERINFEFRLVPSWIDEAAEKFRASPEYRVSPLSQSIEGMSPLDYERHCAVLLTGLGWTARLTKGSGDQGADIIAEKDGVRVVVQCKRHAKPVGNKAVQEALAARNFEDADFAAVVSNAGFTTGAKELAHKGRVTLLHHSELDTLERITVQARRSSHSP